MNERANDKKTRRNIIIFSLIVLSCGWIGRLVDLKVGTDENGSLGCDPYFNRTSDEVVGRKRIYHRHL